MKNGPYELVVAPENYPGFKYRGRYVYKHHLVWWKNKGQLVPKGFVLHHKNEDKRDNRLRNLELKARSDHAKDHARPKTMVDLVCAWCGTGFQREARVARWKQRKGQEHFFCCREHQHKFLTKDS